MNYRDLHIETQREAPNNARTQGFAFLIRAGYLTRENSQTRLGEFALQHLQNLSADENFFSQLRLPALRSCEEIFFPINPGSTELIYCPACNYTERLGRAHFAKTPFQQETELPLEKVLTPDCPTIETLANFLQVPREKTAKALMYTRLSDGQFIFVVVRGDMQISEAKLKHYVGEVRAATVGEIERSGAAPGYASPIGLREALVIVDDLIPHSLNLVAGANEAGFHFINTNCGRDYSAEIIADLVQARTGDPCANCGSPLSVLPAIALATRNSYHFENILLALAEMYYDTKGLVLPHPAAPFNVYLMQVPGKEIDTRTAAEEIYHALRQAGISVLFDDRDERAGVKFNDADLIGSPIRITVGERALKEGMVELQPRTEKENRLIPLTRLKALTHSQEFLDLIKAS